MSCHIKKKKDFFYILLIFMGLFLYASHLINLNFFNNSTELFHISQSFFEIINTMSWGIFLGIVLVGILNKIPREYIHSLLGSPHEKNSILKAALAGVFLDLCSHGILLVGMELYKKGVSLAQVMAFLIASPWNSLSLTIILISLIGLKWTFLFILSSIVIAIISGYFFLFLEKKKILPSNPNQISIAEDFPFLKNLKKDILGKKWSLQDIPPLFINGLTNSKMIIKWLLFGAILTSLLRVFLTTELFTQYLGPSLVGLMTTLFFATVIEVCSEGTTPLAADILTRASAPGNSFTFLMAGVSTDYTEIISLKATTGSWKISLFLPLTTIPQILIMGYVFNNFSFG